MVLEEADRQINGPSCWHQKIPPAVLSELSEIRKRFHAGQLPNSRFALAKAISKALAARKLYTIRPGAVDAWLAKKD